MGNRLGEVISLFYRSYERLPYKNKNLITLCVLTLEEDSIWNKVLSSLEMENGATLILCKVASLPELITAIDRNKVEMVLIRETNSMAEEKSLVHLMTIYPRLRIVVASEFSNWLRVFNKDEIQLTSFTDLVHLINPV